MLLAAHLVDMVQFEVFEEEQEKGRDTLYNDLLVPVHIDAQLHALENSNATMGKRSQCRAALERSLQGPKYLGQRQHIQESQSLGDLNFCARETPRVRTSSLSRKKLLCSLCFSFSFGKLIPWQSPPTYLCNQSLALMLLCRPSV